MAKLEADREKGKAERKARLEAIHDKMDANQAKTNANQESMNVSPGEEIKYGRVEMRTTVNAFQMMMDALIADM
jgi:hypothetical protein